MRLRRWWFAFSALALVQAFHLRRSATPCRLEVPLSAGVSECFEVTPGEDGQRADRVLAARVPDQSRSYLQALCAAGHVTRRSGAFVKKSSRVFAGDVLEVTFDLNNELHIEAERMELDIVFEDDSVLVVNKPAGLVVHPAPGNWRGTLVNGLAHHLGSSEFGDRSTSDARPGIVHRLDKGTSGLLVVAKVAAAHAKLTESFKARRVDKRYLAVCVGRPTPATTPLDFVIDEPIGRHPINRQKMTVLPTGKRAVSRVSTAAFDGQLALASVAIETGRTHQIRVHLAHLGHPILGDEVYGFKDWNARAKHGGRRVERPMLHAAQLAFDHPTTGERLSFKAPPPPDFAQLACALCAGQCTSAMDVLSLCLQHSALQQEQAPFTSRGDALLAQAANTPGGWYDDN